MDLDYQIKSTDFSLKEISAVRVANELLKSCEGKPVDLNSKKMIEEDARERLLRLDLPKDVAEIVEGLIGAINLDVFHWHHVLPGQCVNPVITMLGTVDLEKTLEDILRDAKTNASTRFRLACSFCYERLIFEIGQRLTTEEVLECRSPFLGNTTRLHPNFAAFWTRVYGYLFREQIHLGDLSQETCDEGFLLALASGNDASVKYFIERASPEAIGFIMLYVDNDFSPTTYCLLFSRMTEEQQRCNMSKMCFLLLQALLRWPYQRLFLRAARLLIKHLHHDDYWRVMAVIARRATERCKDYECKEIFIEFWTLGDDHRKCTLVFADGWHCIWLYFITFDGPKLKWLRSRMSTSENEVLVSSEEAYRRREKLNTSA